MSVEAIAIALHHSRATKASTVAVLVGIANHDGDGGAWPAVSTLAHYARLTTRQTQREIRALEALGEISRTIQGGGTLDRAHWERPNLYRFLLECPLHCDRTKKHNLRCQGCGKALPKSSQAEFYHPGCAPSAAGTDRVTPRTPGDTQDTPPVSPVSPKPSSNSTTHAEKKSLVPNRASGREEIEPAAPAALTAPAEAAASPAGPTPCPSQRVMPCAPSPTTGRCVMCGGPIPSGENRCAYPGSPPSRSAPRPGRCS